MSTKLLRKDHLVRSKGLPLSSDLMAKLYRWYDPTLAQGGSQELERIASKHLTLGSAPGIDNNDPEWVASPPSLDFTGDDFATSAKVLPVTTYTNSKLVHRWLHYYNYDQVIPDGVGDSDMVLGQEAVVDSSDPAYSLSDNAFVFGGDDFISGPAIIPTL